MCHMNRMKQIFLYFCLVLALSNCAGTTQGWINQHEWLNSQVRKGDRPGDVCTICGEDWVIIPNEPNAMQRECARQGFRWDNKVACHW